MSKINTAKTVIGYLYSLVERIVPWRMSGATVNSVYNYLPINDLLATSGQPTHEQFKAIKQNGFELVINLAPHEAENALDDEAAVLREVGLDYVHIPVNFKRPTDEDFEKFCSTLNNNEGKAVWVHCAANMRVSSFVYRYQTKVMGEDPEIAIQRLNQIWQPLGVWRDFVA